MLVFKTQLLSLAAAFKRHGKTAVHHFLHLATNALDASTPFNLQRVGGPRIASACAIAAAAMFRTATKTLHNWPDSKSKLLEAGEKHLPMARWHAGKCWPACWDSDPIAFNLDNACRCFPGGGLLQKGTIAARDEIDRLCVSSDASSIKVQKIATLCISVTMHPDTIITLLHKRITSMFPNCVDEVNSVEWDQIFALMRSIGCHGAMCVFKTYVNAWATSKRFHEQDLLECVFGCSAPDTITHYVECPRLWKAINKTIRKPCGNTPMSKLSLASASRGSMLDVAIAFTLYHAIKLLEIELVKEAASSRRYEQIAITTIAVAGVAARSFGRI